MPRPKEIARGVALQHADLFGGDAEPLDGELGVGGLVPLPRGLRPHQDRQGAARVEAQLGEFVGRKARLLDIDGVAEPAIPAARPRRGAPRREAGEIGGGERLVHVAGKLAAVVVEAERGLIRHRLGLDEIAPAQLLRRHAEPPRGVVDQPLDA